MILVQAASLLSSDSQLQHTLLHVHHYYSWYYYTRYYYLIVCPIYNIT